MRTSIVVWSVAIVVVALGAWWFLSQNPTPTPTVTDTQGTPTPTPSNNQGSGAGIGVDVGIGDASDTPTMQVDVVFDASGFSPQEVTVKKGGTVTWTKVGGGNMWVASAQHPTHTTYAGTSLSEHCDDATDVSFDQCENGASYTFTFDKVGTWGYHNHSNSSQFGRVIVVE